MSLFLSPQEYDDLLAVSSKNSILHKIKTKITTIIYIFKTQNDSLKLN